MNIILTSVTIDNQYKALKFYTEILGFIKKKDIPMGEHKWLTVVAPGNGNGVELLLEPMGFEPAKIYRKQLFDAGIPAAVFGTDDIQQEYERLEKLGVVSNQNPKLWGR